MNRRLFLKHSVLGAAGFLVLKHSPSAWSYAANEKLGVALIGVGGRGRWFVETIQSLGTQVVAMCDVNEDRAADSFQRLPGARKFQDFRRMLQELDKQIDAVIVATPDHTHAVAAAAAMRMRKHVYCEKPLAHHAQEARALRELATKQKVATQMGNQGTASPAFRQSVEIIRRGLLGEIREVHAWNDAGGPGRREKPKETQPVPETLHWDLWLGPAAYRPFHRVWLNWHGWRDFGTGNLGNWASHTLNLPFMALKLDSLWSPESGGTGTPPQRLVRVQAEVSEVDADSLPKWEIIRYDFPVRGGMPPVRINWYNGSRGPGFRKLVEDLMGRKLDWGDAGEKKWADFAGLLIVGSKGMLHANAHNTTFKLLPTEQFKDVELPRPSLPPSAGHEREWLDACKGGPRALSNFDYSAPLAEFVLLGNVATLCPGTLDFDPSSCRILNHQAANLALRREYRKGWEI